MPISVREWRWRESRSRCSLALLHFRCRCASLAAELSGESDENGRRVSRGAARRAPGVGHGRGLGRRCDHPPGDPRDGRGIRALVRPPSRSGLAGHPAVADQAGGEPCPGPMWRRPKRRGSGRHGPVLCQDDFSERRQHHPHPGLWQSDRARRLDRGAGARARRPSRSPRRRPIATRSPAPGVF